MGKEEIFSKLNIKDYTTLKQAEADFTIVRLKELIDNDEFELSSEYIKKIHYTLFQDVYRFAGKYRTIPIYKREKILAGLSVEYVKPKEISNKLETIINFMKTIDFDKLNNEEKSLYLTDSLAQLWVVHPFREGNTRSIVTFIYKYMRSLNLKFDIDIFQYNMTYIRTALVAANFEDEIFEVKKNNTYLLKIINDAVNMGMEKKYERI